MRRGTQKIESESWTSTRVLSLRIACSKEVRLQRVSIFQLEGRLQNCRTTAKDDQNQMNTIKQIVAILSSYHPNIQDDAKWV